MFIQCITGGSLIKVVYATDEGDTIILHCRIYPRENQPEAFKFLEELAARQLVIGDVMYTCGIGANEYHKQLENIFRVKYVSIHITYPDLPFLNIQMLH